MSKADFPSDAAFAAAAWMLDCEEEAIRAVAEVEAGPHGAFLDDDAPVILFERHYFHRLTGGRWSAEHPDISNPKAGGYGRVSEQHGRLAKAAALDRDAALKSASWGLWQIMGANHKAAGHATIQAFINAMYRSVDDHLRAFVMFILADPRLLSAIRGRDWKAFARAYNGPGFARNSYDTKMAAAHRRHLEERVA